MGDRALPVELRLLDDLSAQVARLAPEVVEATDVPSSVLAVLVLFLALDRLPHCEVIQGETVPAKRAHAIGLRGDLRTRRARCKVPRLQPCMSGYMHCERKEACEAFARQGATGRRGCGP